MSEPALRSKSKIWLLGNTLETLPSNRAPTKGEVLRYFFYLKEGPLSNEKYSSSNKTIFSKITNDLSAIWAKTGIKTQRKDKVQQKICVLYESYRTLMKHKDRKDKSNTFLTELDEYFYIAHQEAANFVHRDTLRDRSQKEEDLQFLAALKDGKRVVVGSVDKKLERKCVNTEKRKELTKKYALKMKLEPSKEVFEVSEGCDDNDTDGGLSDDDFQPLKKQKKEGVMFKSPTNPLKAKEVCQMADRLNLSLNQATGIAAAVLKSSGIDLEQVPLSKTSCHRYRQQNRTVLGEDIKSSFVPPEFCVLHWDGKIMADVNDKRI